MTRFSAAVLLCLVAVAAPVRGAVIQIEHKGGVRALFWSADGKTLATAGADGIVRFTAVKTGKETRTFSLGGPVYGLAISNDGKWLGVRQEPGNGAPPASVVNVATGARVRKLSPVYSRYYTPHLAFTPDGAILVGAGPGSRMEFRHLRGGASASGMPRPQTGYYSAVAPNGKYAAWGRSTGLVQMYQPTMRRYTSLQVGPARAIAFSPDAKILAVAQADNAIALWDVGQRQIKHRLTGLPIPAQMLTFSGDGKLLGAYDKKNRMFWLWDVASRRLRRRMPLRQKSIQSMRLSKHGRMLATAAGNRAMVWNVARRDLGKLKPIALSKAELGKLWTDLASTDFAKTDAAFRKLAAGQKTAVPFLKNMVRRIAVPKIDSRRLQRLLANLNSDRFPVRAKAQVELEKYGELAIVPLQNLLKKKTSLEVRLRAMRLLEELKEVDLTPDRQRVLETLELLETLATPAARAVLENIAREALIPTIRAEAEIALQRITQDSNR